MPAVEKIIEAVSPGWALKRAKNRRALAYEAAVSGRLRGHVTRDSIPNDYTEARDRMEIIKQARDLRDNFGLFAAIIRKLSIYALGRVRYRAHTGDSGLDKTIDEYIRERSIACDVSGRYSLDELGRMALSETLTAGDIGCTFRDGPAGTAPQLIEADRIGGNLGIVPTQTDWFGGVHFDPSTGRPIEYRIYDRTPAGSYVNKRDIPAANMALIIDPERYDRFRGISPFAPVLNEMRDLKEVMAACLIGVKFNEYHAGFITGGSGVPVDPSSYFDSSATQYGGGTAMTETKLSPGTVQYLPEGYTANLIKSERPSGQFQSYLELLIRTIANALGLPYGFVYSLSELGGPAARMDAAQAQRVIEYWQSVIADRLFRPVVTRWILDGVAEGEIPATSNARRFNGDWQFPPRITIDVGRESAAGIAEIQAGLGTRADWWDEEGKDAGQQMEIIRDEAKMVIEMARKLSDDTDIPFERCLDMLDMRVPNGTPALATTPPTPPAPPPGEETDDLPIPVKGAEPTPVPFAEPKEPAPMPDLSRIHYLVAAPQQQPVQEEKLEESEFDAAIEAALNAAAKLSKPPEKESPADWIKRQSSTRYNNHA